MFRRLGWFCGRRRVQEGLTRGAPLVAANLTVGIHRGARGKNPIKQTLTGVICCLVDGVQNDFCTLAVIRFGCLADSGPLRIEGAVCTRLSYFNGLRGVLIPPGFYGPCISAGPGRSPVRRRCAGPGRGIPGRAGGCGRVSRDIVGSGCRPQPSDIPDRAR